MQRSVIRAILAVVFVGLLAVPLIYKRVSQSRQAASNARNRQAAIAQYGFTLEEVSKAVGINFVHRAPKLDPKLNHIMEQVASMGAAVSIVDFDRDGWDDIYVTNSGEGTRNALYRNLGNGTFENVADRVGLADLNTPDTGVTTGAVWGVNLLANPTHGRLDNSILVAGAGSLDAKVQEAQELALRLVAG